MSVEELYFTRNSDNSYNIYKKDELIAVVVNSTDNPFMWAKTICHGVNKVTTDYLTELHQEE